MEKSPFSIIKQRYVTEKSMVLEGLEASESNRCLKRCKNPRAVFLVDPKANKTEIAWAVEKIYEDQKVKVVSVNTVVMKPKAKRVRGRLGKTKLKKKAIVTLAVGDKIEENV